MNENLQRTMRKLQNNYELMDTTFKKILYRLGLSKSDVDERDVSVENQEGKQFLRQLVISEPRDKRFV